MKSKSIFKHFILLLVTLILILGAYACSKKKTDNNNNNNSNEFGGISIPTPIYYESEKEYIFYSDDYFKHRSTVYDEHLATLSVQMAKYSMNPGNPDSLDDAEWYQNQSNRVHKFFDLIGFSNFEN